MSSGTTRARLSRISRPVAASVLAITWVAAAALDWRFSRQWPVSHLYYLSIALAGAFFGFGLAIPLALLSAGAFVATDFGYLSLPLTEADVIRLALFLAVAIVASVLRQDAHELSAAAVSLEDANAKLEQLNQALHSEQRRRVEYVARAAHDLAQPLTAMKAGADLLIRTHERDGEVIRRELSAISANGRRTANMIENLIEAARLESGVIPLHLKEGVDVEALVREAAQTFSSAERRAITVNVPCVVPGIRADERYLLRLFLNIVGNAVKYSPGGSPVCIQIVRENEWVRVSVRDQGIGIATYELQEVLQPFVRSPEARRTSGFGLGLAISREIVAGHGGRLDIDSKLGGGTFVHILLPLT